MIPDELRDLPELGPWCFIAGHMGSRAYGTRAGAAAPGVPQDEDIMVGCVPPMEYYFGLKQYGRNGARHIARGPWDIVVYEARRMVSLLAGGNPNALSLLWLKKDLYLRLEEAGRLLLERRRLFAGRHVYDSFIGYAQNQFRLMMKKFQGEASTRRMGAKRKALVEQHGYDTKAAMHLIRLLRMGIEFLREGELIVQRPDAADLIAIKQGRWPLRQVEAEAERLFKEAEAALSASTLPERPDMEAVSKLSLEIVRTHLRV